MSAAAVAVGGSTSSSSGSGSGGTKKVRYQGLKGFIAGSVAGTTEILLTYPTEYAKIQLQLEATKPKTGTGTVKSKPQYTGFIDVVKKTVKSKGVSGLYSGLVPVLYGSIPKSGARFGAYEEFKKLFQSLNKKRGNGGSPNLTPSQSVLCGLGAGVVSAVVVITPVETLKVKFINDQKLPVPKFTGFFHGVREILRVDGIRGCYQGLMPTVIKQGSNQGIRFAMMDTLKNLYLEKYGGSSETVGGSPGSGQKPQGSVPKWVVGVFGVIAGGTSVLANNPVDVVKTRMQSLEGRKYKNMMDCTLKIWRGEGWTALYKGTVPRLAHSCSEVAIIFIIFDSIMEFFNKVWE